MIGQYINVPYGATAERMQSVQQIKDNVDRGRTVYHKNSAYRVVRDSSGEYLIVCDLNDHAIGLTWRDGETLNGKPEEFYIPLSGGSQDDLEEYEG